VPLQRITDSLANRKEAFPRPNAFVDGILKTAGISEDLPIVCGYIHRYNPLFLYSAKPSKYFFVVDWDYALADRAKAGPRVTDNLLMEALKRHYPEQNVFPWDVFVSIHKRYLVLEEDGSNWTDYRLLSNSEFHCHELFQDKTTGMRLWLIAKRD